MLKKLAMVFGVVLLLVGVLGFVPGITTDGFLLGIFQVDMLHNIIHLASGAVALWAGMTSMKASKMYFQVFGVVYALVAVLGIVMGSTGVFGMLMNTADNALHVVIAVVALYAGFGMKADDSMAMPAGPAPKPMM
jgi:hypothetical protein